MKKCFVIASLLSSLLVFSQVGINTSNPKATLHVDGGKDNATTGIPTISQQLNDMVVTASGNVGIGTIAPSQKLEIQTGGTVASPVTGFKLTDGNQNNNYVLTTNSSGVGTWAPNGYSLYYGIVAPYDSSKDVYPASVNSNYDTGSYIDLPPGKWMINVQMLISIGNVPGQPSLPPNDGFWIRSTFSDESNNNGSASQYIIGTSDKISGALYGPANYGILTGSIVIDNTSSSTKRFHYWRIDSEAYNLTGPSTIKDYNQTDRPNPYTSASIYQIWKYADLTTSKLVGFGQKKWGENIIYAIPVNN